MTDQTAVELRTPDEWCRIQGVQVLDPDGWRGRNGRPWMDPISLAEFQERLVTCTQRVSRNHPWCDAPDCTVCDAGERRPDTPDLPGEGNSAASAISDDVVGAFSEAYLLEILSRASTASLPSNSAVRAGLTAAYPAIRQQVAEEIAVAIERSEDDARRAEKETRDPGWADIATGYMRSAEIARDVAAGTATARTGTPVTTDLPPTTQALSKLLPGAKA
jgi:hypothetical protein